MLYLPQVPRKKGIKMPSTTAKIQECRQSKNRNSDFQRLHITKEGKKTTISIDTFSYELLSIRLETIPHTKEARKKIIEWIYNKIKTSATYDKDAPYAFSQWLKKEILEEICDKNLSKMRNKIFFDEEAPLPNYDLFKSKHIKN